MIALKNVAMEGSLAGRVMACSPLSFWFLPAENNPLPPPAVSLPFITRYKRMGKNYAKPLQKTALLAPGINVFDVFMPSANKAILLGWLGISSFICLPNCLFTGQG